MELTQKAFLSVLVLVLFFAHCRPSPAKESTLFETPERPAVSWGELIFEGSKLFSSLNVTIRHSFGQHFSAGLPGDIRSGPGDCRETFSEGESLTVRLLSRAVGLSLGKYEEKIWFDRTAAQPHSRVRISSEDMPWIKSYCWKKTGVRRWKIQPENTSEMKGGPARWTKHTEAFYTYPRQAEGCETISEPSLLIVQLSAIELDRQSDSYELCVFGKKQLHRLIIKKEKPSPLEVFYRERSSYLETVVEEKIFPVVFSVSAENIVPDKKKPEVFSFLGLQEDIRIYIDPEKRLPVRIDGTNSSIGHLVLDLRAYSK